MKRGVSTPFVWIFAIIAGAIVLIFLITFAFRHTALKQTQFSQQDIENFEINLDLISQSKSLTTKINLPEISFTCIQNNQYIEVGKLSKTTEKIIFSKKQQGQTTIESRLFYYPYPITHIYYLSDKQYPEQFKNISQNLIPNQIYYEDKNQAECIKQRLIKKINLISQIYSKKASLLIRENPECSDFYREAIKQINLHSKEPNQKTAEKINKINNEINLNGCPELW